MRSEEIDGVRYRADPRHIHRKLAQNDRSTLLPFCLAAKYGNFGTLIRYGTLNRGVDEVWSFGRRILIGDTTVDGVITITFFNNDLWWRPEQYRRQQWVRQWAGTRAHNIANQYVIKARLNSQHSNSVGVVTIMGATLPEGEFGFPSISDTKMYGGMRNEVLRLERNKEARRRRDMDDFSMNELWPHITRHPSKTMSHIKFKRYGAVHGLLRGYWFRDYVKFSYSTTECTILPFIEVDGEGIDLSGVHLKSGKKQSSVKLPLHEMRACVLGMPDTQLYREWSERPLLKQYRSHEELCLSLSTFLSRTTSFRRSSMTTRPYRNLTAELLSGPPQIGTCPQPDRPEHCTPQE